MPTRSWRAEVSSGNWCSLSPKHLIGGIENRDRLLKRLAGLGLFSPLYAEGKHWLLMGMALQDLTEEQFQTLLEVLEEAVQG
ncbi:hypothetical protein HRbin23_00290 [bacterium HR23]|nr:hypothetical protein HRbin23_00290 [bacterium HR23]